MRTATVKVQTKDGDKHWPLLAENIGLCVLLTDRDTFSVTHELTGLGAGKHPFLTLEGAKGYMNSIANLYPWADPNAKFDKEGLAGISKACKDNFELWQANEDDPNY